MNRNDSIRQESNFDFPSIKEDKVVLWDFDTMLHHCIYSGYNEEGIKNRDYTMDDLDFLQGKLTEMYLEKLNKVEEHYNILALYIFIKGEGNFRKNLYPDYKSKRLPPNPLLAPLYEYAEVAFKAIKSDGFEADDMIATFSRKINHNGIILAIDGDLHQLPSIFYNYQKDTWKKVSEEEARYNTAKKVLMGDNGDGVNFSMGIGEAYVKKNLQIGMSDYQYIKNIYKGYLKAWKNDNIQAKKYMKLAYELLRLHDVK